jgi:hypothetical protein
MDHPASDKCSKKNSFDLNGTENMHLPKLFGQINANKSKRYNE